MAALAACGGRAASGGTVSAPGASALPALPSAATLQAAATERAEALCDARAIGSSDGAAARYDQESWTDVVELAGRAPLDPPGDAAARGRARAEVVASWRGSRRLADGRWDRIGTGEVVCDDHRLYVVAALARTPQPSDAGAFAKARYRATEVDVDLGLRYRTARSVADDPVDLLLDVYQPPRRSDAATRPAVVLVHGGGFAAGARSMHAADALGWARRGFVAITIDYRLDPDAGRSAAAHRAASLAALEDATEAIRWVRGHAARYGIDPDRIAALGASAGGEIALGLALLAEPSTAARDVSSRVAAAVSTGAYLTPVLASAQLDSRDDPVLLHYFETDTTSGRRWTYAAATCEAVRAAGATCDLVVSPGAGHTIALGPSSPEADRITAFLATQLDLTG